MRTPPGLELLKFSGRWHYIGLYRNYIRNVYGGLQGLFSGLGAAPASCGLGFLDWLQLGFVDVLAGIMLQNA